MRSLWGLFVVSLICCLLSFSTWGEASKAPPSPFSISNVESLFGQGKSLSVSGVEDLLGKMPKSYRSFATALYETKSNHRADEGHPRLVFFGPDAKLITAVSTLPTDPKADVVEMIAFDDSKARFDFYELDFGKPSPTLVKNPGHCVKCHRRSDPRPNWEPYSLWPGAYGSLADRIEPKTKEYFLFEDFIKGYTAIDRAKHLVPPFYTKASAQVGEGPYFTVSGGSGSNALLTVLLSYLNRERIARQILESPRHEQYKFSIAASLIGCHGIESFLPEEIKTTQNFTYLEVLADTKKKTHYDFERRVRRVAKSLEIGNAKVARHADRGALNPKSLKLVAKLRYLLEFRAENPLAVKDWSMAVHQTSFDFNDGSNGILNLAGHYLPKAFPLREAIVEKTKLEEVEFLTSHYKAHGKNRRYGIKTYRLPELPSKTLCRQWKEASLQALAE